MGCLFIDSAVPNNDAESIADGVGRGQVVVSVWGGGLCSHCVCGVHYSLNECPFFWGHYLSEKGTKKKKAMQAGAVARQAGHK